LIKNGAGLDSATCARKARCGDQLGSQIAVEARYASSNLQAISSGNRCFVDIFVRDCQHCAMAAKLGSAS
jgi:hypothetical protein